MCGVDKVGFISLKHEINTLKIAQAIAHMVCLHQDRGRAVVILPGVEPRISTKIKKKAPVHKLRS